MVSPSHIKVRAEGGKYFPLLKLCTAVWLLAARPVYQWDILWEGCAYVSYGLWELFP